MLRTRILNRMLFRRGVFVIVVAALTLAPLSAFGQSYSLESQVMSLINGGRSPKLIVHSGLADAARGHSQEMSRRGGLDHYGADERVANAAPDPVEINGAPDDGFATAAWCENVTYVMAAPESEVAQRIYNQWHTSAPHDRCMNNTGKNVGAVGIYYDGQTWWATFIAEVDNTPPGGVQADSTPAPHKTTAPRTPVDSTTTGAHATQAPSEPAGLLASPQTEQRAADATAIPTSQPVPVVTTEPVHVSDPEPSITTVVDTPRRAAHRASPLGYGWQELLGVAGVLMIATLFALRSVKRAPEMERRDRIALPEVEPMRSGALSAGVERHMVAAGAPRDTR